MSVKAKTMCYSQIYNTNILEHKYITLCLAQISISLLKMLTYNLFSKQKYKR